MDKRLLSMSLITIFIWFYACGDNGLSVFNSDHAAEDAVKALEQSDPEEAERLCLNALGETYKGIYKSIDYSSDLNAVQAALSAEVSRMIALNTVKDPLNLLSILASARAQIHGVDLFNIAVTLSKSAGSSSNEITVMFPALPEASAWHILGLKSAILVLNSMDASRWTKADYYKSAMFLISSVSLNLKSLDINKDGQISAEEALGLSEDIAVSILSQIASASAAVSVSSQSTDASKSKSSSDAIAGLSSKIDSQSGASVAEKLKAYISASSQ